MIVTSTGIVNGIIEDRFGSKGDHFTENGMPNYSIPFIISDVPDGTVTFAVVMEDRDAIPVCGFSWIHWTIANLTTPYMEENGSVLRSDIVQGVNSYHSKLSDLSREEATGYGGPDPPDREHEYELTVYALNSKLNLEEGFYMNELFKAMDGHVISSSSIRGIYSPEK